MNAVRRPRRPLALAYHGVDRVPMRQDRASLFVPAETVTRHIRLLRRWGYRLVTFSELAARTEVGDAEAHCALTFDDGFADNVHTLLPILEGEGAPATVFIVSSWLGASHPDAPWARTMTADEIKVLAAGPVEIGSHSHSHRDLSSLTHDEVVDDFTRSKETLEEIIGRSVTVAAYPYGYATDETAKACAAAGFRAACRISGQGSWYDPMQLPREDIHNYTGAAGFYLKQRGMYEPLMRYKPIRMFKKGARRVRSTVRDR